MKHSSFSTQLATLWILVAALCATLVAVVWLMANSAESQQIATARQQALTACEAVASRWDRSAPSTGTAANADLMHAILDIVLVQTPGVEGGFWSSRDSRAQSGFLAYAFPTYPGSGIKRDIPEAETPLILRTLQAASTSHAAATNVVANGQEAVIVTACPVQQPSDLFAWMLARPRPRLGQYGEWIVAGLAGVLTAILVIAIAVAIALRRWKQDLARIEAALSSPGQAARLARTGEPDLDRIVNALNQYVERAETLQRQAAELGGKLAHAERFSLLGKLAAQVAHEIRNPIGAMRLRAENALAGDSQRQQSALRVILEQIGRIEAELASLLALTQPVSLHMAKVEVTAWLSTIAESYRELAQQRAIRLSLTCAFDGHSDLPTFDPEQMRRALDNLVFNALRHADDNGTVAVVAGRHRFDGREWLRITVSNSGPGVPPEQHERIFEPFVTGRADGSGLGLAVVREVASAHGGRAWLDNTAHDTSFIIEIPWRPSS